MKRVVFLMLLSSAAYAQRYVAEAPLGEVKQKGFYSIYLPPHITAALPDDLHNIRILDSNNVEVPYLIHQEKPDYNTVAWKPMKFEKATLKNCCTVITLENKEKNYLDNILLQVKNAEINKTGVLRGSNDGSTWFAVIEKFQLLFGKQNNETVSRIFDFPLSNYAYYQLTINDSVSTPLNIVGAQTTQEDIVHGNMVEIPDVTIISRDSAENHATWATVRFDTAQYVDRLEFDIGGPHLFKRRGIVFRKAKYKDRTRLEEVTSFDVMSGQARPVNVFMKEKEFYVRVENENNPPIKFNAVAAYQFKRSLIAYFEKEGTYRIALGDNLETPYYDLGFFRDSIPAHPAELEIGKLKERSGIKRESSPTFFRDPGLIWAAIGVVMIVLIGMTVRMLRDKDFNKPK